MSLRDLCLYVGGMIIGWTISFTIKFLMQRKYRKKIEDILKQEYD